MTHALVSTRHEGGIVEIALSHPPVNALGAGFLMDFAALVERLGQDASVTALVVSSPFKVFSAGLDLKKAQDFDLDAQHAIVEGLNLGFLSLFACPKPTVAAVGGAALAGGLFFVLAADFRVAGPRASFGLPELRVGVDFPVGPMEIARATLAPNELRRLMLTGQPVSADAALAAGIVDELCEAGEERARALDRARDLAANPPLTYASIKRQIRGEVIARIEAAMAGGANRPAGGWFNRETKAAMRRMIG